MLMDRIPEENMTLWTEVIEGLKTSPSLYDIVFKNQSLSDSQRTNVSSQNISSAIENTDPASDQKSPETLQRKLLALLSSDDHSEIENLVASAESSPSELANCKALLVSDEDFIEACVNAAKCDASVAKLTALYIVLPKISQVTQKVPRPIFTALSRLVESFPLELTEDCLAPTSRFSKSDSTFQLLAELLLQLRAALFPHLHHIAQAFSDRSAIDESNLPLLEAACTTLPPMPQPPHSPKAVESIMAALAAVGRSADLSRSPKVGKLLLLALQKMGPHANEEVAENFKAIVEQHKSPLQRALQAQIKKLSVS